jgi:hypothetical protein
MFLEKLAESLQGISMQARNEIQKNNRLILLIFLLSIFVMKMFYTFSRDTFMSGPDAEGYIKAGSDIAKNGILSSEISNIPFYPIGYPIVLALGIRVFDTSWIQIVQIFQILLSCFSLIILYLILKRSLTGSISLFTVIALGFSPAYFVFSSQAIPDNLVQFLLLLFIYRATSYFQSGDFYVKPSHMIISGTILGFALVVHPRILFLSLFALIVVFKFSKLTRKNNLLLLISVTAIPVVISVRNLVFTGTPSLASSTSYAFADGHPRMFNRNNQIEGPGDFCAALSCKLQSVLNAPLEFLQDTGYNLIYFWSPHSGALQSGVWFHNISIYRFLDSYGFTAISKVISASLAAALFLLYVYGTFLALRSKHLVLILFSIAVLIQWLISGLIYGSNLHRMTVVHLLVPIQFLAFHSLLKTIKNKRITYEADT